MAQNRDNFLSHSSLCSGKINGGGAIKFPIRFEGGFVFRRIKWEAESGVTNRIQDYKYLHAKLSSLALV